MVVTTIGGGPAAHAAPQNGQRRLAPLVAGAWRSVAWRAPPSMAGVYTGRGTSPVQSPHCGWPARAYTLASEPAAVAATHIDIQTGSDLNDMCTLQLGMLYQLLARAGTNYTSMRCGVYARNFMAVGPGQVKLVRVAQFPVVPGQHEETLAQQQQQQSTLLLHTEQSWALQGGSAAVDPSAMIEDCLLHREVVALPSSSSLIFPLVDAGVLVGLLVVELETDAEAEGGAGGLAGPVQTGMGMSQALLGACSEREGSGAGLGASAAAAGAERRSEAPGSSWDLHNSRPHRKLTEDELRCLRLSVPLLAKACGMDARASWQLAQSSVGAAAARGLLREAQRPLSTLNTFSTMLFPRLKDGDPDKDMAKGILTQGKRLQDLMWQLEDALHGSTAAAPGASALGGISSSNIPVALPGAAAHPPVLTTPPFRTPSALPRDPNPAVQELLQLPPPRLAALSAGAQPQTSQTLGADTDVASLTPGAQQKADSAAEDGGLGPAPVLPGRVTFVGRTSSDAGPATLADGSLGAFTIRQPAAGSPRRGPGSGPLHGGLHPGAVRPYPPPTGPGAATATIDVEMDSCESQPAQTGAGSRPTGLQAVTPSAAAVVVPHVDTSRQGAGAPHHLNTNLASALAGVLTAACRLAAVSGIGFIVNSPLSSILPLRGGAGSGSGKSRPAAFGAPPAPATGSSHPEVEEALAAAAAATPRLIPRPVRPLVVGVRPALVQKVVGYMLDIALQCTPRGGQVCVSARQDGAGVQVQVLHSGRMDLQRLHARSQSMVVGHTAKKTGSVATHAASQQSHGSPAAATAAAAAAAAATGPYGSRSGTTATATPAALATRPAVGSQAGGAATSGGGGGGGGMQTGSGVLSVEMAQELAQQAGGYLTVSYPFNMVNAQSGSLDVGTSVEIWLPGPSAALAH